MLTTLSSLLHVPVALLVPAQWLLGKATALLLLAMAITMIMRRTSADSRHLVWFASLAAVLVIPVVITLSPVTLPILPSSLQRSDNLPSRDVIIDATPSDIAVSPAVGVPSSAAEAQSSTPVGVASPAFSSNTGSTSSLAEIETAPSISAVVLTVWAVVAVIIAAWLALGMFMVARIVRRATPLSGTDWDAPLYEIADRLSLDEAPRLVSSADVAMPFACGLRTPTIVLPATAESWSAQQRAAVLLHEMAHIKRRDIVAHSVGRFACALYWFHPLVWTAAKRLRAESERACDDLALLCGARPSDYAEHLLDIVARVKHNTTPPVALAMATRSEFEGRMLAILDPALRRVAVSRRQSVTMILSVAVMAVVIGIAAPASSIAATAQKPMSVAEQDSLAAFAGDFARREDGTPSPDPRPNPQPAPHSDPRPEVKSAPDVVLESASLSPTPKISLRMDAQTSQVMSQVMSPVMSQSTSQVTSKSVNNFAFAMTTLAKDAIATGMAHAAVALGNINLDRALSPTTDSSERASLLTNVLLREKAPELRRIAAWGLRDFADQPSVNAALLTTLQRDTSASVREMSAWALASSGDDGATVKALLVVMRNDRAVSVRETAIWAIAELGAGDEPSTIAALSNMLTSDDQSLREISAWALGTIQPRKAPPALLTALTDASTNVRITSAWALHQIEDEAAVPALDRALRRESSRDAQLAQIRALSALGEPAIDALKRLIDDPDANVRGTAIRALAGSRGDQPWPWPRPRPRPYP